MKKNGIFYLLFFIGIFLIYKNWFISPQIIGGDWPFFYQENINNFSIFPPAWSAVHWNGFGGPLIVYALDSYLYFTGWLLSNVLHIPWNITYKIVWFGMFLSLGAFSFYRLIKGILPDIPNGFALVGSFIFLTNTYILLVAGGGQMGFALGYAIFPLVLLNFINVIDLVQSIEKRSSQQVLRFSIIASLLLAAVILFDFRLAYIVLTMIGLYFLWRFILRNDKKTVTSFFVSFTVTLVFPVVLALLMHMYWILPSYFIGQSSIELLGSNYTAAEAVRFFSFATFENTIALLQPLWPENIFGKVGFMRAEFLLLPILAYSSLFFLKDIKMHRQKTQILFFVLLGLLGAFLAKGANDPFGGLYLWLFETVPGFVMFRDPTKWYILIALAYSVLIPFSLWRMLNKVSSSKYHVLSKRIIPNILLILTILYILLLLRPAFTGELSGTFASHQVPAEYIKLKDLLIRDDQFSRTLWVPRVQRFVYADSTHPPVESLFVLKATNSAELIKELKKPEAEKKLADLSIKYVIIPLDSEKEIFLKDRKYNNNERKLLQRELDNLTWLKKDNTFRNLQVYTVQNSRDHLWLDNERTVSYRRISSSQYTIDIAPGNSTKLVFNENYSPYWILEINGRKIQTEKEGMFNSFNISQINGTAKGALVYSLDKYYEIGRFISFITLLLILIFWYFKLR